MNHALRITLPYDDCKGIISKWADRCTRVIVYQHDADEEVSKTHVHLGLYGCEVRAEALKRMWSEAPGKGNEFWSWKEATEETRKYIAYMSKGHMQPKFVKNFSQQEVEESRQTWVEPVLGNDKSGEHSEKLINSIMKQIDMDRFTIESSEYDDYALSSLFGDCRSKTFRVLWAQHRKAPHAGHYKIIAGTVFLRLCEQIDMFDRGSALLRCEWY